MFFQKKTLHESADLLASSYLASIKEHRARVKAKTQEIDKCIKEHLAENHSSESDETPTNEEQDVL